MRVYWFLGKETMLRLSEDKGGSTRCSDGCAGKTIGFLPKVKLGGTWGTRGSWGGCACGGCLLLSGLLTLCGKRFCSAWLSVTSPTVFGEVVSLGFDSIGTNGKRNAIAPWIPTEARTAIPVGWLRNSGTFFSMETYDIIIYRSLGLVAVNYQLLLITNCIF
jgi:hypothetical protein